MNHVDFLSKPTPSRLRREIINICDSYSHPWDILAELCQNSVDALRSRTENVGLQSPLTISIRVDAATRSISVADSGVGIPGSRLAELLSPHSSDKDPKNPKVIGQKGVGLTYALFSSNHFHVESSSNEGFISGNVIGALNWRHGDRDDPPQLQLDDTTPCPEVGTFTKITLSGIEAADFDEDIFRYDAVALIAILRTKTAIGCTTENPLPIEVSLTVKSEDGTAKDYSVPYKYLYPEEVFGSSKYVDLEDFMARAALLADAQKVKELSGKCIRMVGSTTRVNRTIRYHALFPPSRRTWDELNRISGLPTDGPATLMPGIYVATRGMPAGMSPLAPPTTGAAGYWSRLFILLEDDSLKFDLGRKSIPGRTQGLLREISREIFSKVVALANFQSTDPAVETQVGVLVGFNKAQGFEELKKLPKLDIGRLPFDRTPSSQEAGVSAIFHEMLGAGLISGYRTLKTGYKMSYDLWATYVLSENTVGNSIARDRLPQTLDVIIEFKVLGQAVLADLEDNKLFQDIDIICCWDFDEAKLAPYVAVSAVPKEKRLFNGANYEFNWAGAYNLGAAGKKFVISLRQLIEEIKLT